MAIGKVDMIAFNRVCYRDHRFTNSFTAKIGSNGIDGCGEAGNRQRLVFGKGCHLRRQVQSEHWYRQYRRTSLQVPLFSSAISVAKADTKAAGGMNESFTRVDGSILGDGLFDGDINHAPVLPGNHAIELIGKRSNRRRRHRMRSPEPDPKAPAIHLFGRVQAR